MELIRYRLTIPTTDAEGKNRKDVWKSAATELANLFDEVIVTPEQIRYRKDQQADDIVKDNVRILTWTLQYNNTLEPLKTLSILDSLVKDFRADFPEGSIVLHSESHDHSFRSA